jgi:hypothetical protein
MIFLKKCRLELEKKLPIRKNFIISFLNLKLKKLKKENRKKIIIKYSTIKLMKYFYEN